MSKQKHRSILNTEMIEQFYKEGYILVKGLFANEAEEIKKLFMNLHAGGAIPNCFHPLSVEEAQGIILKQYPRMLHPHRVNEHAKEYMIHPKLMDILADILQEEPLAAQSMFYFKPPGAKGQALHQDNFYLKVEPGTCVAAWVAVDSADEENGGLYIVPQTNSEEIQCPHEANPELSFTNDEVDIPQGKKPIPVHMKAGDVLFFNGSMIHGSYPNTSKDRFRRAFICHYTGASVKRIGEPYLPLHNRSGKGIYIDGNMDSGPCGTEFK
jgi:phytanoyl-CoA hydroxylase